MISPAVEVRITQSFGETEQLLNSGWEIASRNTSMYGTDYLMTHKVENYEFEFPTAKSSVS
ncbi:MAG: hypothetical protein IJ859_03840 [Synergistaceae bacterium]|nr:hypothetical protein [Synergistaceae bacterium]